MNDRKYLIIPAAEVKKVDFDKVLENSSGTLAYSGDGKRTFVKWIGEEPEFVQSLKNTEGPYDHEKILEIVQSEEWINPKPKKSKKKVT